MKKLNKSLIMLLLVCLHANANEVRCAPVLWPNNHFQENQLLNKHRDIMIDLIKEANKSLKSPPHPIQLLSTAGKTDINNNELVLSRKSLQDADRSAVLSLAYQLTHNKIYLEKSRNILLAWASVNQPTGNPVDENRLAGMIWAYDLISCSLSSQDKSQILTWFEQIKSKKLAWHFGPSTSVNNHRIHQLKMLLLLNKVLGDTLAWQETFESAKRYSTINIDLDTGETIDYRERSALYYHNYALQSWVEIGLLSHCCQQSITHAMDFLTNRIRSNNINEEFSDSTAKIDKLREQGGFEYAKKNGTFQITRAAPTIVAYDTLIPTGSESDLWTIVSDAKPSPWLTFLNTRRVLWNNR